MSTHVHFLKKIKLLLHEDRCSGVRSWDLLTRHLGKGGLEKEMATHCSILAWRVPWTEEPGGLQSMGLQRDGRDWATNTTRGEGDDGAGWWSFGRMHQSLAEVPLLTSLSPWGSSSLQQMTLVPWNLYELYKKCSITESCLIHPFLSPILSLCPVACAGHQHLLLPNGSHE